MTDRRRRERNTRAAGYTLLEVMVAVVLTMFIVLAVTTLFSNNSVARKEIDNSAQQIENGRYTMELIRSDVRIAGYYGEFVPTFSGVSWQVPANPCDPTLANLGWNATGTLVPVPISGFEGHDAAIDALSPQCIANRAPNSDVLVVRRTSTTSAAPPPAAANTPYLQVSTQSTRCVTAEPSFVLDVVRSPSPFTMHQKDCASAALVRQYLVHIYYVSTCDDCTANDGIPTLKRVELSGGSMTTVSLTQGVADFRVDYGLDANNDGFPDSYVKCGASATYSGPCTATDWSNVVAIKVHLLTRNIESTPGYVDSKSYVMGLAGTLPAFSSTQAGYKHHVYSSPIRVNGPSDLRELP